MKPGLVYTVGVRSGSTTVYTEYQTKREAVAALAGAVTIQKPARRLWIIVKGSR